MDVFKVLSRSTKFVSSRNENKATQLSGLPSEGKHIDPQLYHDDEPDSRRKKRKRNMENPIDETISEDSVELNFFAPKSSAVSKAHEKPPDYNQKSEKISLLDESECQKILRSHRIKIALLKPQGVDRKKAKKTKRKEAVKAAEREEYKSIYPQPLMDFSDLRNVYGISNRLAGNLEKQGYKIPTEVQMASLPLLLRPEMALGNCHGDFDGKSTNLLAIAPTGSGKTLAFLIPIIDQILQRRRQSDDKKLHVLEAIVIAPTKELADQIVNEAKILCEGTGVKTSGMRKGMRIANDSEDLAERALSIDNEEQTDTETESQKISLQPMTKADILVSTPGLLLNALSIKDSAPCLCLPSVRTLVLDEADILLEPLFRDQTCSIWSALTHPQLRTTLWSATISSSIENLSLSIIRKRFTEKSSLIRLVVGLKDSALPTISHTLTYCGTETGKLIALRNLLHNSSSGEEKTLKTLRPPVIIFTQTIPRATALHAELLYDIPPQAGGSSRIAVLHSSLSAAARTATLNRFRSGEIWVMITTDLLSRGIDFRGVNAVVNYDIPNDAAGYIHRVGRTGRGGRKGGVAVTFYTREDVPFIRGVVNVIEASRKSGENSKETDNGTENLSWLLDVVPKIGKKEKKDLKFHGVEARRREDISLSRGDNKGEGKEKRRKTDNDRLDGSKIKKVSGASNRISTKSGYERKLENRKKGAIEASKRKKSL
ncbi:ATP-dependent RNA helicase ROK1 [Golovinomyces cichoracearum]|uniref:ATP-dependent RNA helicase n=1 Tax=Golovinomyces cichoracearum TaxID=62708 RepID=A0A420IIB9_9PEZI|nr:ATP-dependent RNA helicase ROK1 [Golovinomyces cichoracearum]